MNDITKIELKKDYKRLTELPLMVISIIWFIVLILFRESFGNFLRANGEFPFIVILPLTFIAFAIMIHFISQKLMIDFCLKQQFSRQQLDHYHRIAKIVHTIAMITMMVWLFVVNFFR